MRTGICCNMNAIGPDGVGLEWLNRYRQLGFDYVELPVAQLLALTDAGRRDALARVKDCGLPCHSMNNFLPADMRLLGGEYDRDRLDGYLDRAMGLAESLGAKVIVFGSSGARNLADGYPMERAMDELADRVTRFGDAAARAGVTIVIEHLNRIESNVINSFAESAALAKLVNHKNVMPLLDIYHFCVGNDDPATLDGVEIGHAHFARPLNRTLPCAVEFERYAPLIRRVKGDFSISIEAKFSPEQGHECIGLLKAM